MVTPVGELELPDPLEPELEPDPLEPEELLPVFLYPEVGFGLLVPPEECVFPPVEINAIEFQSFLSLASSLSKTKPRPVLLTNRGRTAIMKTERALSQRLAHVTS